MPYSRRFPPSADAILGDLHPYICTFSIYTPTNSQGKAFTNSKGLNAQKQFISTLVALNNPQSSLLFMVPVAAMTEVLGLFLIMLSILT